MYFGNQFILFAFQKIDFMLGYQVGTHYFMISKLNQKNINLKVGGNFIAF